MALETSETILDGALAMRSEASVSRVTRRVHAWHSEAALFARRLCFSPTVPVGATPEFVTSGIGLGWRLRLEFVVPVETGEEEEEEDGEGEGAGQAGEPGGYTNVEKDDDDDDDDDEADDADHQKTMTNGKPSPPPPPPPPPKGPPHPLLEEIARDQRGGLVLVAAENVPCESFEVAVPLRIYGAVCNGLERLERDELGEGGEGLPV